MAKRGIVLVGLLIALAAGLSPVEAKKPPPPEPADPEIAYYVGQWKGKSYRTKLMVMDADGSNQTEVIADAVNPEWSPDGDLLLYEGADYDGLYVVNVDGTGNTKVLDLAAYHFAWCPVKIDGEDVIAFSWADTSVSGAKPDLYLLYLDGSDPVQLTDTTSLAEYEMTWSPSGDRLAYRVLDADNEWCWGIYDLASDEYEVYEHVGDFAGAYPGWPCWSRTDENLIAWAVWHRTGASGQGDLWLMDISDVTSPVTTRLTNTSTLNEGSPCFSPDDSQIVFGTTPVSGTTWASVEVIDADGSNRTTLAEDHAAGAVWKR